MSKFDNISEKNNSHIYSIFRTETSLDPKGVTNPPMKSRLRGDTSPRSRRFRAGTRNESQRPREKWRE